MNMADFIIEFERRYNLCKHKMEMLETVLSFKLLDYASLTAQERQLALTAATKFDFSSMKSALKRIFCGEKSRECGNHDLQGIKVKQESAFFTRQGKKWNNQGTGYRSDPSRKVCDGKLHKGTNPLDKYGRRSKKRSICQSVFH
jgi:hypothetical protein